MIPLCHITFSAFGIHYMFLKLRSDGFRQLSTSARRLASREGLRQKTQGSFQKHKPAGINPSCLSRSPPLAPLLLFAADDRIKTAGFGSGKVVFSEDLREARGGEGGGDCKLLIPLLSQSFLFRGIAPILPFRTLFINLFWQHKVKYFRKKIVWLLMCC